MYIEQIPVTPFQQNCCLIWDENKNTAVIDPGGDVEKIITRINELDLKVKRILLTHGHLDHVGASCELKAHTGAEIWGSHKDDAFLFETLSLQATQFGFPPIASFSPDRWLNDGDRLQIGEIQLQVLHVPGHTPGHIALVDFAHKRAFVGDVLFHRSIGRTDFVGGNHQTLIQSIQQKLLPLGDDMQIFPGHGLTSTIGEERCFNPFLQGQMGTGRLENDLISSD